MIKTLPKGVVLLAGLFVIVSLQFGCVVADPTSEELGYRTYAEVQMPSAGIDGWESSVSDCSFAQNDARISVESVSCEALGIEPVIGIRTEEDALQVVEHCPAMGSETNAELIDFETIRIDGTSAKDIEGAYVSGDGVPARIRIVAIQFGDYYTLISLVAPDESFESYRADFESFLDAIKTP